MAAQCHAGALLLAFIMIFPNLAFATTETIDLIEESRSPNQTVAVALVQPEGKDSQAWLVALPGRRRLLRIPELDGCKPPDHGWPQADYYWNRAGNRLAVVRTEPVKEQLWVYQRSGEAWKEAPLPDLGVEAVQKQLGLPPTSEFQGNHDGEGLSVRRWVSDDVLEVDIQRGH